MSDEFRGSDRYAVIRRIGAGGMGVVYEAQDLERGTRVALKTLRQLDPTALYRFKHEFRSLADVCHPNLVYLHELVSAPSGWFFVMELIEGVDFLQWVRADAQPASDADSDAPTRRRLPMPDDPPRPRPPMPSQPTQATAALGASGLMAAAQSIVRPEPAGPAPHYGRLREALLQLVDGVNALHSAGKLHRDIKPSNILVAPDGRLALLDFGLTTGFDPREGDTTFAGKLVGTAGFVSPEQCAGKQPTTQSDWYGVGVVLYLALVGRLPFTGSPARVLADKRRMDPPAPRQLRPETPPDLDALCMALLCRNPDGRPTGSEILRMLGQGRTEAPLASPWTPRLDPGELMGRNSHLLTLRKAYEAASAGQAVTVYVRGSSGMGKTALIQYFLDGLVETRGALVLRGRAHERESVPYKAFDSLIDALSRQLLRLPPDDCLHVVPEDAWALARIFPVLARVTAIRQIPEPVEGLPPPALLRRKAFLALRSLLDRLARLKKLVLFLDDLQWGDLDSASLLLELMRPPLPPPLLLIGSYRSEDAETSPMVRALASHRRARGADVLELVVGPLRYAESHELAIQLLGSDDAESREQAASIAFEAKGSPFLIAELARWTIDSRRGSAQPPGEVSLEAALQQRLSAVFEGGRHVLELVAVSGRPVDLGALAEAAGLGERHRDALASLRAARLLRTSPRAGREVAEPYDDRIREAVLASMDPARVLEAHRALALAHERAGAPDPEALSEHLAATGDRARCAHYSGIAADRASQSFAFAHAARLYQRALDHFTSPPHDSLPLRLGLAEALANCGRPADSARAFSDAAARALDQDQSVELSRRAAEQWLRAGQIDHALTALAQVLHAWRMPMAGSPAACHRRARLSRLQVTLRGLRFRQRSDALVADESLAAIDVAWSAAAGLALIDPVRATDYVSRSLLLSLRAGEPFRAARSLCGEAVVAGALGRRGDERSRKVLDLARDIAQRTDSLHAMGLAAAGAGVSCCLQGQWKSAREWCDRAEPILGELRTGTDFELGLARIAGLHASFLLGDLEPLTRVPDLVFDADARGDGISSVALRIGYLNLAWLLRDDEETALRQLREARARWSHGELDVLQLAGLIGEANFLLYTGDSERAFRTVDKLWDDLKHSPLLTVQLLRIEALWLRGRCLIAAAADRRSQRADLAEAEQLARELASVGCDWALALSLLLRACAARLSRDDQRAVALFGQAEDACVQCDMAFHAVIARRRLGRLIGGASGARLLQETEAWMTTHGVGSPDRITKVFAPGTFHIRFG